jgi:Spy/CpxP family protein refolding chaperone
MLKRTRSVLAAQQVYNALTPEQQREFRGEGER